MRGMTRTTRVRRWIAAAVLVAVAGGAGPVLWPGDAPGRVAAADAVFSVGGQVGLIRPLTGINIGPLGNEANPSLVDAYRTRGITLIRTHDYYGPLDLATMYPDRSRDPLSSASYGFATPMGHEGRSSDTVFASIVENGFEPYFRLGDSYNNARAPSPGEIANLTAASVQVLRHYREGQWQGFRSAFRYVEIWNDPDNRQFWSQPADVYFDFYVSASRAIREAFPGLRLGGPALMPAGCKSPQGQAWTRRFLDHVRQHEAPMDLFSWHMYSNDPADYAACAAFYRAELDARGFAAVPMHVTEWNTESRIGAGGVALRAMAQGASINTGAWMAMQENGIEETLFYRGPDPTLDFPEFYGMFYADGRPKAVGLAAELWHEMTRFPRRMAVSGGADGLMALAGTNTAGGTAVLVTNLSNRSRTWSLEDRDEWAGTTAHVRTVSDDAQAVVATTSSGRTFVMPPYGVQLVTIEPRTTAAATCAPARSVAGGPVTDPNGPYHHRVAVGHLDGNGRVDSYTHVLDHASVPDGVRLPDGRLLVYYVNGEDGAVWAARIDEAGAQPLGPIAVNGVARPAGIVDPDVAIVRGRVQLTYLSYSGGMRAMCVAESTDGLAFRVFGEALRLDTAETITDPSVVALRDGSWLMAVSAGTQSLLARSSDGYRYVPGERLTFGGVPELARLDDGRLALYVCGRGIQRYVSTDEGGQWTFDGTTVSLPGLLCDPSHVAGTNVFVFKTGR